MNPTPHWIICLVLASAVSGCSGKAPRADGAAGPDGAPEAQPRDAAPEAQPEAALAIEAGRDGPDASLDADPDAGPFTMRATLIGMTDHAGTEVEFPGTGLSARTDSDGRFTVPGLPDGTHAVRFRNGAFEEEIPQLIVRRGAPFVRYRNDTERSFPEVELPRGHRLHSAISPPYAIVSPAHGWLLIRGATLTLLNSEGRQPRVLASDADQAHGFIDENRVFFGRRGTGISDGSRLMTVPVAGGPEQVWLSPALSTSDPIFVLLRTKVIYSHAGPLSSGPTGSSLVGLDGKNPVEIGVTIGPYAASPDGFWFAAQSSPPGAPGQLRLTDVRTGQTRMIDAALTDRIRELTFTPDSRWLVYGDGRRIMSAATAGGAPVALGLADSLVISPDGRFVLVRDRYDSPLLIVAVDSGSARVVPSPATAASHSMHRFSRDSRYIFPSAYPVAVVPVDTLTPRQLSSTDSDVKLLGYISTTQMVYFTSIPRDTTTTVLSALSLGGPAEPQVVLDRPGEVGQSRMGRFLYFADRFVPGAPAGAVTVIDQDGGRSFRFQSTVPPLHFAPDDSRMLSFDGASKVQVADLRDGKVTTVGTSARVPDLRGFSPDGSRLVFGTGGVFTLAASDGSTATVFARQIATAIQWNGNRLIYPIYDSGDRPAFVYGLYLAHEP